MYMTLFNKLLKLFSCKSECKFNDLEFDFTLSESKLSEFELKNKDIIIIHRILSKRNKKEIPKLFKSVTQI